MSATEPANGVGAITPSDTTFMPRIARCLYIGGAGDVTIDARDGTTATFTAVPAGSLLPVWTRRVRSTGTTATNITAPF